MLLVAVVIDRDHAASNVGFLADTGVAQIAQMAGLGAAPDARLLGLDEIADPVVTLQFGALAQMGERSQFAVLADSALLGSHSDLQIAAIADYHVAQPRRAVDAHTGTNPAAPEDLHVGPDDRVDADFNLLTDIGRGRIDQRDSRLHQPAVDRHSDFRIHLCQLLS